MTSILFLFFSPLVVYLPERPTRITALRVNQSEERVNEDLLIVGDKRENQCVRVGKLEQHIAQNHDLAILIDFERGYLQTIV